MPFVGDDGLIDGRVFERASFVGVIVAGGVVGGCAGIFRVSIALGVGVVLGISVGGIVALSTVGVVVLVVALAIV